MNAGVELKHIASSVFWLRLSFFGSADRLSLLVGQTFFAWKVGIQLIPHRTFAGGNRVKAQRTIYPFGRQIKNNHNPVRDQPDRSQYVRGPRRTSLFPKAARPAAPCATYCYHASEPGGAGKVMLALQFGQIPSGPIKAVSYSNSLLLSTHGL